MELNGFHFLFCWVGVVTSCPSLSMSTTNTALKRQTSIPHHGSADPSSVSYNTADFEISCKIKTWISPDLFDWSNEFECQNNLKTLGFWRIGESLNLMTSILNLMILASWEMDKVILTVIMPPAQVTSMLTSSLWVFHHLLNGPTRTFSLRKSSCKTLNLHRCEREQVSECHINTVTLIVILRQKHSRLWRVQLQHEAFKY